MDIPVRITSFIWDNIKTQIPPAHSQNVQQHIIFLRGLKKTSLTELNYTLFGRKT